MDSLTANYNVIMMLLMGGLLGALGQGIRVWFGLKETIFYHKITPQEEKACRKLMPPSIFIGFVTGLFIVIFKMPSINELSTELIWIIIASGFVMSDFVENVIIVK